MKNKAQLLERRVKLAKLRSLIFAGGAAAALLLGMIFWYAYYASSVLSYAELDAAIRVERSAVEPDRLTLFYRPVRAGKVGFRRLDKNRETELLDRVSPGSAADEKFEWRWNGVQVGDVVKVTFRDGWSLTTKELRVPEAPQAPPLGDAKLTGAVVSATDGKPVPGAQVRIVGTPLKSQTDSQGEFVIEQCPTGTVSFEVSAPNFGTEELDQELGSTKSPPVRVVLSPGLKSGQIRLVLTWGDEPADLDAHLEGPLPDDKKFHIYFQQKGDLKSKEFVNLDVDAKTGHGPETITVLGVLPGTYHYFVHDYTNRDQPTGGTLSRSGAEVRLYQGGQTYRFRANNESPGTVWHICDVNVDSDGKASVTRIDRYDSQRLATLVDLVFLLDVAPGTDEYLQQRAAACLEEAQRHQGGGLDCRFALVPFGQSTEKQWPSPISPTGDLKEFEQKVAATDSSQPLPKNCVAAMEQALKLNFRPGAAVQFLLITSSPFAERDRLLPLAQVIKDRNVQTTVYARAAERETYLPICKDGGQFVAFSEAAEAASGHPDSPSPFDVKKGALGSGMKLKGIYAARTQRTEQTVVRAGGSQESETAVAEGLNWLARHQAYDGHWSDQGKCEAGKACPQLNYNAPIAQTGLAILAFQAGGNYYFNDRKYSDNVTRGLDWLVTQQPKDGRLFGNVSLHDTWYQHGIATFALTEACAVARAEGREPDARYLDAATRAVMFLEKHQYAKGGWQYSLDSKGIGDTSVTGWQILALKSALEAKIDVSPETMRRVQEFFEKCGDPSTGLTGYQARGGGTDLGTAVGLVVQEFIAKTPDSPLAQKAILHLAQRADQGIGRSGDFYTLYNSTLAMFLAGGESWNRWNSQVRDAVVLRQEKQGCARGSWNDQFGRTLGTAWAVLTLEVYYRYNNDHAKESKPAVESVDDAASETDGNQPK